jgi:hypothetical protein
VSGLLLSWRTHGWGPALENRLARRLGGRSSGLARGMVQLATRSACASVGTAQRATIRGHRSMGGALTSVGLRVTIWRSSFMCCRRRSCAYGRSRVGSTRDSGRCTPCSAPPRRQGRGRPQVDGLRRVLKPSSEAGKWIEVDGGVDDHEHIIVRHGFVGRQGGEQGDPEDTGLNCAARTNVTRRGRGLDTVGRGARPPITASFREAAAPFTRDARHLSTHTSSYNRSNSIGHKGTWPAP